MSKEELAARRWDAEYLNGTYEGEPHIEFVNKIKRVLNEHPGIRGGVGLYAGCGNGRNFVPLAREGLDMVGIDISKVAINKLAQKIPEKSGKLQCADFLDVKEPLFFEYVISIQVFQHGDGSRIRKYFENASRILKDGGLLFLRVNSASTDIFYEHDIIETNKYGGISIRYLNGPKQGMDMHFYTKPELEKLCEKFEPVEPMHEDVSSRMPPKTGMWGQWELVLAKK